MSETKLNKKTEIFIAKRPYSCKEYYSGDVSIEKNTFLFSLIITEEYEDVIWNEEKPKSHREIELDIIKQFKRR